MELKFFFFFIIVAVISLSSASKLKCEFIETIYFEYSCEVQNNGIFGKLQVTIDQIEGNHNSTMTNNDVKAVSMNHIKNLSFVPKNIYKFFTNLVGLKITDSNLTEIYQSDFQNFSKLECLILDNNQIEVIEKELFKFNLNLEMIVLKNNKISHIDHFVFSKLKKLKFLILSENVCKLQNAKNRTEVENLIKKIFLKQKVCISKEKLKKHEATKRISHKSINNEVTSSYHKNSGTEVDLSNICFIIVLYFVMKFQN
ncbi:hypothetical protein PVAND_015591 [Polypedilum vanderplanki]|uniref:Uncharacterized protein n=1 Tax=Polypedilum vanderplanki TaxID=319348 RepID=A0A9J6BCM4_POLVA|nr:hypothetical protein PVAND_015591 [Polypedilum vanderplanki]